MFNLYSEDYAVLFYLLLDLHEKPEKQIILFVSLLYCIYLCI